MSVSIRKKSYAEEDALEGELSEHTRRGAGECLQRAGFCSEGHFSDNPFRDSPNEQFPDRPNAQPRKDQETLLDNIIRDGHLNVLVMCF